MLAVVAGGLLAGPTTPAQATEPGDLNGNGVIDSRNELVAFVMETQGVKLAEAVARLNVIFGVMPPETLATRRFRACAPAIAPRVLRHGTLVRVGPVDGPADAVTTVGFLPTITVESLATPCYAWVHEGAHALAALHANPSDLLVGYAGMDDPDSAAECLADRIALDAGSSAAAIDHSIHFHRSTGLSESWMCVDHPITRELAGLLVDGPTHPSRWLRLTETGAVVHR